MDCLSRLGGRHVHQTALEGFRADTVQQYEAGRPSYSQDMLYEQLMRERARKADDFVLMDLASGTGKLLSPLSAALDRMPGSGRPRLLAVEPSGLARHIASVCPQAERVDATAETVASVVGSGVVDSLWVGQAFHWFANASALSSMADALKPGGRLNLIWNLPNVNEATGFMAELERVLDRYYEPGTPRALTGDWAAAFAGPEAQAAFGPLQRTAAQHTQRLSPAGVAQRLLSISVVARQPAAVRAAVQAEVERLARSPDVPRDADTGEVVLSFVTELHSARRL